MTSIDIRELPVRIEELLALVASGDEVIVSQDARPLARLVPYSFPTLRVAGLHADAIQPAADFDASLPDEFWSSPQ